MKPHSFHRLLFALVAAVAALGTSACGPGPYGFAKYYVPTEEEELLDKQSSEYPYGVVAADPGKYQDRLIAWFGIVKKVTAQPDGRRLIVLSHNRHKERHLCDGQSDKSCRVTVQFKETGRFSALVKLRPEDLKAGLDMVQPGTLMRIIGKLRCQEDEESGLRCDHDEDGRLLLEAVYYRQWPARFYVTTRAASALRR